MQGAAYQRTNARNRDTRRTRRHFGLPVVAVFAAALLLFFYALATNANLNQANGSSTGVTGNPHVPEQMKADQNAVPAVQQEADRAPETPEKTTQGSADDWNLILVNPWNSLPEGYEVTLTHLKNGQAVDERCYPDLQEMMDDCRASGLSPVICSSYRTWEKQEQLFDNKVRACLAQGFSGNEAETEAGRSVAVPGTSEHQLGLAVDIVDIHNQNLNASQEQTDVTQWMLKNSWKYGFILRYPSEKSAVTGIVYEPWHYRYVGREVAAYIYENDLCMEEYLEWLYV